MMKSKYIIAAILSCNASFAADIASPDSGQKKIQFASYNELNVGLGEAISVGIRTVNGIKLHSRFFTGIGLGIDYYPSFSIRESNTYNLTTLPLYADVRYDFFQNTDSRFFIYADAGVSNLLSPARGKTIRYQYLSHFGGGYDYTITETYKSTFMYGGGLGTRKALTRNLSFLVSIGYNNAGIVMTAESNDPKRSYSQNAGDYISLRMGLAF